MIGKVAAKRGKIEFEPGKAATENVAGIHLLTELGIAAVEQERFGVKIGKVGAERGNSANDPRKRKGSAMNQNKSATIDKKKSPPS